MLRPKLPTLRGFHPSLPEIFISSQHVACCLFLLLTLVGSGAHAQSEPEAGTDMATAITTDAATAITPEAAMVAAATPTADTWEGKVSYLARKFTGHKTASGERFNPNALTMAHKTLPFGTVVRVTNLRNGKTVHVRVNDRGPFVAGRVADLSLAAARALDMLHAGVAQARLEVLSAFN